MIKELKIKSLITICIIAMIVIMNTVVLAADTNYSAGILLTSNSKLKEGETVTINVNLSDVNAGAGIDALTAEIEYDTNVFEELSTSSFTSSTNWTPTFAASTNKMTALKNNKVTAAETMFTITLKVKSEISVDSTTITLKDIVVSGGIVANGGTGDIQVNNASVTINKEKDSTSTTTPTNNTVNNTTNIITNTTIKDNTITNTATLPKTGIEKYGTIAIVVVAIIGIFSYALYKKIAKDVK